MATAPQGEGSGGKEAFAAAAEDAEISPEGLLGHALFRAAIGTAQPLRAKAGQDLVDEPRHVASSARALKGVAGITGFVSISSPSIS